MKEASSTSDPQTSLDLFPATSLQGSEAGLTPCASPDGPTTNPSGPGHAHASHSASQASSKEQPTCDISGRTSAASSASADLQRSLASRLRASLDVNGSLEYTLTWKEWDMPQREPICALRASARRISDSASSGWPTPTATDAIKGGQVSPRPAGGPALEEVAGWVNGATPQLIQLAEPPHQQELAGWATPCAKDDRGNHSDSWGQVVKVTGPTSTSSLASTEKRGALNPAHSRWLMGYPAAWDFCGATAMQLIRSLPRNSSKRAMKP
jgi:hypothetical protein